MAESPIKDIRASGAQHELLLAVVYSIYRTVREQDRWPLILKEIQELLGARACCLAIHDFQRRVGRIAIHSGCFKGPQLDLYNQTYSRLDPWLRHEEHYRTMDVSWVGDELLSRARLVNTDFHREWLIPQDLTHQCSGILFRNREHLIYLRSYRAPDQAAFNRDELYPLQRLLPHLRQTLELHCMLASRRAGRNIAMEQFVGQLGGNIGIIEAQRRLLDASAQFEEFVISEPQPPAAVTRPTVEVTGAPLSGPAPSDPLTGEAEEINEAMPIGHMIAVPAHALDISRKQGRRWLPVLFNRTDESEKPSDASAESDATAETDKPNSETQDAEKRLKQLYNLTPSEAKLAELLASGCDLPRAAWQLNIGLNTVRTHLQRIYSKTDTHHQSELVALLLAGPARLRVDYHRADNDQQEATEQARH